jgi:hypothetical protein
MKRLITLITALALIFAANAGPMMDPIPNASYAIYEGGRTPSALSKSTNVTFYTFDGDPIITLDHLTACPGFPKVNRPRLDPYAPKPQPVTYEIKYASKFPMLVGSSKSIISFYDKNDNVIKKYEYNNLRHEIVVYSSLPTKDPHLAIAGTYYAKTANDLRKLADFPLDLSRITEKPKHSKKLK